MSKRGEVLLKQIQEVTDAVDDVEAQLLVNDYRRRWVQGPPRGKRAIVLVRQSRAALLDMKYVLTKRLNRARELYLRHLRTAARRCGVVIQ